VQLFHDVLQIRDHDRSDCAEKAAAKAATEPSAARPTSVPSTGVHFLSHFLDDRVTTSAGRQGNAARSRSPADIAAKEEDNTTTR
jgi:hypothetical protein